MKCLKISKYLLLVFLLLSSVFCYSLSLEDLQGLETQTLKEIILVYDQGMTDLENSTAEREKETDQRESQLNLRENRLNERDSELIERDKLLVIQEALFKESLIMHETEIKRTKFIYSTGGLLVGFLFGYPVGYYQHKAP